MTDATAQPALDERALDERLTALESARSWSPRTISRLESRIRAADDYDLFRINPMAYAAGQGIAEAEAIDLFLHATKAGLFDMAWDVVCGGCGCMNASFRSLARVDPHVSCQACQLHARAALDDLIQVTFTISPAVRRIRWHDPEALSVEDFTFRYGFCRDVAPTPVGLTIGEQLERATRLLGYLGPDETASVDLELSGSMVAVRDVLHAASAIYWIVPPDDAPSELRLALREGRLADPGQRMDPFELDAPAGRFIFPATGKVGAGPARVTVENAMSERASVWVVEYPPAAEVGLRISFEPLLSARQLLSTQTFRTLFRSETVSATEALDVRDLTFLFTDLQDSTAMYGRIGDATAYDLVRRHFDVLETAVRDAPGAVVKTIGDAVMATFVEPADAVRAALDMFERLESLERSASTSLALKVGLHRGQAVAVTSNERVDYFGQAVNIAARVQGLAGAGEICLSEDVYADEDVQRVLEGREVEMARGSMKGVTETVRVYRVVVRPAPEGRQAAEGR